MASFQHVLRYYSRYRRAAIWSIAASSLFQVVDLAVPYSIGQILNVLSQQPIDPLSQGMVDGVAAAVGYPAGPGLALALFLAMIFFATVVRAPIQPWLADWFHWDIALRTRRDHSYSVIRKLLTLPLGYYDLHNPGRISGRVAGGLSNHTWTYPEIAGQLIPKLIRITGIFVIIWWIDWRIALVFLVSFIGILSFSLKDLIRLNKKEQALDTYMENTESRTSEIITNIKTVKAFAAEGDELRRQSQRLRREFAVVIRVIHKGYVILGTWQDFIIQSCVFGLLVMTLLATLGGHISLGHFITTLTVSSMAYSELEPISNLGEVFARRYASMLRFHEFMEEPLGTDAVNLVDDPASLPSYQFTGKVHFDQVSFGYDDEKPVLQNIDLLIEPYQTVALVGRSGSGKSTLMGLSLK